jgi:putative ABC transport system permease protein
MSGLIADLRQTWRANLRNWPSSALIVLLLGAGIGATVAMVNIHDAMAWRPLPFRQPEALVALGETRPRQGRDATEVSWPTYLDWRREPGPFPEMGAFQDGHFNVGGGRGEPENIEGVRVTPSLFPMLGVEPLLGRAFLEQEGLPGRNRVLLISHALWETRFLKDPSAVGRTLLVDGEPHVIVGVMPPRFAFPELAALWMPLAVDEAGARRDERSYEVIARLGPGIALGQAQAQMDTTQTRIARLNPESNTGWGVLVRPLRERMLPPSEATAGTALSSCAAILILAITCANVGLLLLARFQARSKETAVRLALGAARSDLTRRFLLEAGWLALAGGLLGLPLSILATRLTAMAVPSRIPYWLDFGVRPSTFVLAAIVSCAAAVMAGLLPAARSSRLSLGDSLKDEARSTTAGGGAGRLRQLFAIGQFAMSFVLLASALLIALSYFKLQAFDRGFDARQVLTMRFSLRGQAHGDEASRLRFVRDLLTRAQGLPGVSHAAVSTNLPLRGFGDAAVRIVADGRPVLPGEGEESQWRAISASYLETFQIPLLAGRTFTASEERAGAPVALVSDALARQLWPNADAIGRRLRVVGSDSWSEVIGVTATVRRPYRMTGVSHAAANRQVYAPPPLYTGRTWWLALRTELGTRGTTLAAVMSALRQADRELPFFDASSMEDVVRRAEWVPLLWVRMFTAFSLMALILTSLGTYGMVSHTVGQRTREIGVRMALGAPTAEVSRQVLSYALRLAAIGVAGGLVLSAAVAPLMRALVQDTNPRDPLAFGAAALALALTSVVATALPAWRAARIDPMVALRCE